MQSFNQAVFINSADSSNRHNAIATNGCKELCLGIAENFCTVNMVLTEHKFIPEKHINGFFSVNMVLVGSASAGRAIVPNGTFRRKQLG